MEISDRRLRGGVAVGTGATSGIGRASAERFAAEGARAVVADPDSVGAEKVAAITAGSGLKLPLEGVVEVSSERSVRHLASERNWRVKLNALGDEVDGRKRGTTQILIAEDSPKARESVASLNRRWWTALWGKAREAPRHALTIYHPYYFQSWKATIPKTLGRTMRIRLVTGVNGMSRSVGPATEWPVGKETVVEAEEVIPSRTSEAEAERLSYEYIKEHVARRYRPSKPPSIEKEEFQIFYVPYYVYAKENQPLHKADLVEGFTGSRGRVKDVPAIYETVMEGRGDK